MSLQLQYLLLYIRVVCDETTVLVVPFFFYLSSTTILHSIYVVYTTLNPNFKMIYVTVSLAWIGSFSSFSIVSMTEHVFLQFMSLIL
jgi:hypothetical protein